MWSRGPRRPPPDARRPGPAADDGSGNSGDGGFEQCAPAGKAPGRGAAAAREEDEAFEQIGSGQTGPAAREGGAPDAGREGHEGRRGQGGRDGARSSFGASGRVGKLLREQEPLTAGQLRMRGIALLARREHSRAELQQKLKRYTEDEALIVQTLDQLQAEKLLSDARFAEGVARVRGARYGSARVAQDLRARGVSGELAAGLVRELKETDLERAQAAWQKRFGEPAEDASGRAKQMRFLQSRGFSPEVIRRVVPRARAAQPEDGDD